MTTPGVPETPPAGGDTRLPGKPTVTLPRYIAAFAVTCLLAFVLLGLILALSSRWLWMYPGGTNVLILPLVGLATLSAWIAHDAARAFARTETSLPRAWVTAASRQLRDVCSYARRCLWLRAGQPSRPLLDWVRGSVIWGIAIWVVLSVLNDPWRPLALTKHTITQARWTVYWIKGLWYEHADLRLKEDAPVRFAGQPIPEDLNITIERGGCFGPCPVYSMTVLADGTVIFEGRAWVSALGRHVKSVDTAAVAALLAEFDAIDFYTLQPRYIDYEHGCSSVATDHETVSVSITAAGHPHWVQHYHGCWGNPLLERLKSFEDRIDAIVQAEGWLARTGGAHFGIAPLFLGRCKSWSCAEEADRIARSALLLFWQAGDDFLVRRVVVCSNGTVETRSNRLRFIDSIVQARLTTSEYVALAGAVSDVLTARPDEQLMEPLNLPEGVMPSSTLVLSDGRQLHQLSLRDLANAPAALNRVLQSLGGYLDERALTRRTPKPRVAAVPPSPRLAALMRPGQWAAMPAATSKLLSHPSGGPWPLSPDEWDELMRALQHPRTGGYDDPRYLAGWRFGVDGPAILVTLVDIETPHWLCAPEAW